MAERKYQFERLTPTDNVDLDVYEDAINYVFEMVLVYKQKIAQKIQ